MLVTNQTTSDIYFGPLHLGAGIGTQLTIDDTSATSLYLTDDAVADAVNNAYNAGKITVSGAADPFPRPTGVPSLLHGDGNPEGMVFAPHGSVYMRRDGTLTNGGVLYLKTTGVTLNTGWIDIPTASGATAALPTGTVAAYAGSSPPTGWLLCDGSAVSRSVYSTLFSVISTTYGAGDGSSTFNLPDLRGRMPAGRAASGGHADVSTLGNNEGIALANRRPRHYHPVRYQDNNAQMTAGGGGTGGQVNRGEWSASPVNVFAGPSGAPGDGTAQDAPAYLVINYIIKA